MSGEQLTLHLIIEGRVQGVGYRAWTSATARKKQLQGWVRNRSDGTVEALLHGEKIAVESMVELCWKGPLVARVKHITAKAGSAPEEAGFVTLPTF